MPKKKEAFQLGDIHEAAADGDVAKVKQLVGLGADPNERNEVRGAFTSKGSVALQLY